MVLKTSTQGMLLLRVSVALAIMGIVATAVTTFLNHQMSSVAWLEDRTDKNALKVEILERTNCATTLNASACLNDVWTDTALQLVGGIEPIPPGTKRGKWNLKAQCRTNLVGVKQLRILFAKTQPNGSYSKNPLSKKPYSYVDLFFGPDSIPDEPGPGTPCNKASDSVYESICEGLGGKMDSLSKKCRFDGLRRIASTDASVPDISAVGCLFDEAPSAEFPQGRTREKACRPIESECYDDTSGDLLYEAKVPTETSRRCKNKRRVCYFSEGDGMWVVRRNDGTLRKCNLGLVVSDDE